MMTRIACMVTIFAVLLAGTPVLAGEQAALTAGGTGSGLGILQGLGREFTALHPEITIKVLPSLGSAGGIRALRAGAIDLAISSRPLKGKEKEGVLGVTLGGSPLVFAVHPDTPISDITLSQAAAIYSGTVTAWRDGTQIRRIVRPADDSDWLLMQNASPELAEALEIAQQTRGLHLAVTDTDAVSYLEQVRGSFGPTTLAMVLAEKRQVRVLSLAGLQPIEAGPDQGYPLRKVFRLVVRIDTPPAVLEFLDFIRSSEGRKILAEMGVSPLEEPGHGQ